VNETSTNDPGRPAASAAGASDDPPPGLPNDYLSQLNLKLRTPLNVVTGFADLLHLSLAKTEHAANLNHIRAAARELLNVIDSEMAPRTETPSGTATSAPTGTERMVLYIEDDKVNYELVEAILEYRPSLKLKGALSGALGLQLARTDRPSIILLDLNLPDVHGAEVLRGLRDDPDTAAIPVVVVSADATASQIERLLSAGARNYVTKPINIVSFLAVIDEIVRTEPQATAGAQS
jgi:CheY-like chemotaxis protein